MAEYDGEITLSVNMDTKQVTQTARQLSNELQQMFKADGPLSQTKQFQSWQVQVDKVLTKSMDLNNQLQELESKKIPTDQYTNLQKEIDKAEKALLRLYDRRESYEELGKQAPERLSNQIVAAEEQLARLENGMQQLVDEGKAFTLGRDTAEFANISGQLNGVNNQMVLLRARGESILNATEQFPSKLSTIMQSINMIVSAAGNLLSTISKIVLTIDKVIVKFGVGVVKAINKADNAIKSMFNSIKSHRSAVGKLELDWGKLIKKVLAYGLGIRSLYRLFNIVRNSIKEGFNNLVQFNDGINDTNKAASRLYSSVMQLKNALGAMVAPIVQAVAPALDVLINKLIKASETIGMFMAKLLGQSTYTKAVKLELNYADAVKKKTKATQDASKALAGYDKLNNISSKKADAAGSDDKGQLDPNKMFKEVTIPSQFDDWVNKLKKWWKDADFTELGTILGNKLKDALDNIPWDDIKENAYKVGKSLATLINGFVEVDGLAESIGRTIGEAINTGVIGINAFLDNTHWDSVGKFIGDGINSIFTTIDWDAFGHMFAQLFNSIFEVAGSLADTVQWEEDSAALSEGINKFIDDVQWEEIGENFGKLVGGIFAFIDTAYQNIQWEELGTGIGDSLNKLIETVSWETLGSLVSNKINAIADIIGGLATAVKWEQAGNELDSGMNSFIAKVKWDSLGTKLGTAVGGVLKFIDTSISGIEWADLGDNLASGFNNFIEAIPWESLGNIFANGLNAITDVTFDFATNFEWRQFGDNLGTSFNTFMENTDWAKMMQAASKVVLGIFDTFLATVETINWIQLGSSITTAIANIDWGGLIKRGFELIGAAIGGIVAFVIGLLVPIFTGIGDAAAEWWEENGIKDFNDIGRFIFEAIPEGIGSAVVGIGLWLYNNVFKPIFDGICSAFDIHSPSKVMEEVGENIIQGMLNGFQLIQDIIDKIIQFKDDFMAVVNDMKDSAIQIFNDMGQGIADAWDNMWEGIKGTINWMLDGIESFVNFVIDGINEMIDALNGLSFEVPDWVPGIGGETLGFNIANLSGVSIPRLAQGAILPPNKPFLAMVGDQKQGTNIEAPLDTIVQAMVQAITQTGLAGNNDQDIVVQIDGHEIARATRREDRIFKQSTGHSMFAY